MAFDARVGCMADTESADHPDPSDTTAARIAAVAAELRAALTPLLESLAGSPPRPVRLMRGPGLDKSLASRLVQATRADSDQRFLHTVPSPTGLRILIERSRDHADAALLRETERAVNRFEALLDALPGGRQALDAHMGESSASIRERREQMARQASFKAVSFLFGHYCDTLATALVLVPSGAGDSVDVIEVHRRIGLQRLSASTPLPLLSVQAARDDEDAARDGAPFIANLAGDRRATKPWDVLIEEASNSPLPDLQVHTDGALMTFVLGAGEAVRMPSRLTTAYRVVRAQTVAQSQAFSVVRNYMLHTPCRRLVRDVFIARGLWPDAQPQVGFYLPGPSGTPAPTIVPGAPHLRRVNLTARIEQLPSGAKGFALEGVDDQPSAMAHVLSRAGVQSDTLRGWRCEMSYPVPLIEMQVAFTFASFGVA